MSISGDGVAAAFREGGENEHYTGSRLLYAPVELQLNDEVSARSLGSVALISFVLLLGIGIASGVLALIFVLAGAGGFGRFLYGVGSLGALVAAVLVWVLPLRTPISEWGLLLDGRASSADSAYAAIYGALRARATPVVAQPVRVRTELGQTGNYLKIEKGRDQVYVSALPFGNDLFLGWMIWRSERPAAMVVRYIKQRLAGAGAMHRLLQANDTRALRDALHNSVRQGADVAAAGQSVPIASTFGFDIPVVSEVPDDVPVPSRPQSLVMPDAARTPTPPGTT